jgi:hypothetical protein
LSIKTTYHRLILLISLVCTYFFFAEYLRPFNRVAIPFDLDAYHYPMVDYAFQALRQGRLPEWDPSNYSGMPFCANIQAAFFYPPMWLLYAANLGRERLGYNSLQIYVFLHVWLTFVLCYYWLRQRQLLPFSAVMGAAIFGFSGYAMLQLQHMGVIAAFAWFPLGFLGVDEVSDGKLARGGLKISLASALCFLAGYPPTWFVFVVCAAAYALCRKSGPRVLMGLAGALAVSVLLMMVQL